MARYFCLLFSLALAALLPACVTDQPGHAPAAAPPMNLHQYPLRSGDRVRVELSGISEVIPPSEQDVHDDGTINLPYIGSIKAEGVVPSALEQQITARLVPAYFTRVTVTVTPTALYFFVGGQINNTTSGRILYSGPITIMGAIQAAGDFNPFADRRHVQITRVDGTMEHVNCVKAIKNPKLDVPIYPGDRIWVGRRF